MVDAHGSDALHRYDARLFPDAEMARHGRFRKADVLGDLACPQAAPVAQKIEKDSLSAFVSQGGEHGRAGDEFLAQKRHAPRRRRLSAFIGRVRLHRSARIFYGTVGASDPQGFRLRGVRRSVRHGLISVSCMAGVCIVGHGRRFVSIEKENRFEATLSMRGGGFSKGAPVQPELRGRRFSRRMGAGRFRMRSKAAIMAAAPAEPQGFRAVCGNRTPMRRGCDESAGKRMPDGALLPL